MRVAELIDELKKYDANTDVALRIVIRDRDEDGVSEVESVERMFELKPWNEMGFCVLLDPI